MVDSIQYIKKEDTETMSEEGDKNVVDDPQPDKDGKYPETVSWKQYVGTKESLGKKLEAERQSTASEKQKVTSLEEKLKEATSAEEFTKVKTELDEVKGKLQTSEEELTTIKNQSLSEKRESLTKRGIPEEKTKDMSVKELDAAILALGHSKPGADLGGGGGSGDLKGSPMELAVKAYTK